jgi:hypothetical protein
MVTLAADYLFHDSGFSKAPVEFHYPTKKALSMGLLRSYLVGATAGSMGHNASSRPSTTRSRYAVIAALEGADDTSKATSAKFDGMKLELEGKGKGAGDGNGPNGETKVYKSLFERELRVFAEGTHTGRVLLIDEDTPGRYGKNEAGVMEYVVTDALSSMNILDIRHLLGSSRKLTIR